MQSATATRPARCSCHVMEQDYWDIDAILAENQVGGPMLTAAAPVYF